MNGTQAENQTTIITVRFTNETTVPCVLQGIPTEPQLVQPNGAALALDANPAAEALRPAVLMQPGVADAASMTLDWANWCSPTSVGPLELRFTLAETGDTLTTPLSGQADGPQMSATPGVPPTCVQPDQPSTLTVTSAYLAS